MSRIGKIARLPKAVREELNRRMEDGEEGKGLVAWLNGHAEVHAVLKVEFDGKPVNEPNLTAWRQGGYEDWRRQQESLAAADRMAEETSALDAIAGDRRLVDRAADMAALALGQELMAVRRMEDGDEKRRAVLKLVRGLVRLRKSDREQERGLREAAQAARAAEVHEDWAERMTQRRRPAPYADARGKMSEVRKQMAEVIAGMSDEEIADTLRRSGRSVPAEPAKRVWWTAEDEALEGDEDWDEAEKEDDGEEDDEEQHDDGDESRPPTASTSTSTSMSTRVSADGADASGHPPSPQGYGETSKLPPTVETKPPGGGLIQS